ncbi:MAG: hypothetical protein U0521_30050 [Anaerolineae bacterium]
MTDTKTQWIADEIASLKEQGLFNTIRTIDSNGRADRGRQQVVIQLLRQQLSGAGERPAPARRRQASHRYVWHWTGRGAHHRRDDDTAHPA